MKVAALNKQKIVVRVGQKHCNVQCKQPHVLSVLQSNSDHFQSVKCGQYFLSYLRKCALQTYEAPDFLGLYKNNYAFHFTVFKNVSVSLVVSLTIKTDITLH